MSSLMYRLCTSNCKWVNFWSRERGHTIEHERGSAAVLKILKPRGVQEGNCVALKSQLNSFITSCPFDVVQVQFKVQQLDSCLDPLVLTRKKAREKVDQRD